VDMAFLHAILAAADRDDKAAGCFVRQWCRAHFVGRL